MLEGPCFYLSIHSFFFAILICKTLPYRVWNCEQHISNFDESIYNANAHKILPPVHNTLLPNTDHQKQISF